MSRRVRECRAELRKFMREVKKGNPAASVCLQYDKLYVDGKCFVWNDHRAKVDYIYKKITSYKVTELAAFDQDLSQDRPGSVLDRWNTLLELRVIFRSSSSMSLTTSSRRTYSSLAR